MDATYHEDWQRFFIVNKHQPCTRQGYQRSTPGKGEIITLSFLKDFLP